MKTPTIVLNQKYDKKNATVDQKVTLSATLGPKGYDSKTPVYWTVTRNGELLDDAAVGLVKQGKRVTKAKVSVKLPTPMTADVFKITARTDSGASATTTVMVVKKTTEVAIANAEKTTVGEDNCVAADKLVRFSVEDKNGKVVSNKAELKIGGRITMKPVINIGGKGDPSWVVAGTNDSEEVTYTVDKKGIVNIDAKGNVYAINSGTVKIKATTPLKKKVTLTVVVAKP